MHDPWLLPSAATQTLGRRRICVPRLPGVDLAKPVASRRLLHVRAAGPGSNAGPPSETDTPETTAAVTPTS